MCRIKFIKKGECLYILNDKIKYYTREALKLSKIVLIGFFVISAIILIKYKPMYTVKIGNSNLGYLNSAEVINDYIEEIKQDESIAFVNFKEEPKLNIKLVNRNTEDTESIKEIIDENLSIEYTSYAVTYNGNNVAYLSNMEKAEEVINSIKDNNKSDETKDLGILQVYSDNYEEIKGQDNEEATTKIAEVIKKAEEEKEAVKLASTASQKTTSNNSTTKATNKKTTKTTQKLGISFSKPLSGTITSRYGGRTSPGGIGSTNHKGLDISAKNGTTIKAAASGTVKFAGYKGSLGNLVIIDHGNKVETYYGHCSKLLVEKGQKVEAGEAIAAVGSTGAATGPHLHFEIHINGTAVNPQNYLY